MDQQAEYHFKVGDKVLSIDGSYSGQAGEIVPSSSGPGLVGVAWESGEVNTSIPEYTLMKIAKKSLNLQAELINKALEYHHQFFDMRKKQVLSGGELDIESKTEFRRVLALLSVDKPTLTKQGGWFLYFEHGEVCPVDGKELLGADLFLECYGRCDPTCSPEEQAMGLKLQKEIKNNTDPTKFTVHGPVPFQCPNRHTLSYDGKTVTVRPQSDVDKFLDYCIDHEGKAPGAFK